ncbi:MAG: hypothetical protein R2932_14495 [Caldilineaceae bacterium]
MLYTYAITIHHLYVSPGHNYFTHAVDAPGKHPTIDLQKMEVHAGQGIVGDRFYGRGPSFDGHVTFFSWEVYQELVTVHELALATPAVLRRNVVIEGVPLNGLIGQPFAIGDAQFRGAKHCAPCRWMEVAATGALVQLKGRGGLRAQVLKDGVLQHGAATLTTAISLDLATITNRLPRPRLP